MRPLRGRVCEIVYICYQYDISPRCYVGPRRGQKLVEWSFRPCFDLAEVAYGVLLLKIKRLMTDIGALTIRCGGPKGI